MTTIIFEELTPRNETGKPVTGMMLYGTAELASNEGSDKYEYLVDAITIEGGERITRKQAELVGGFIGGLFKLIAAELENTNTDLGRYAQDEFAKEIDGE